MSDSSFCHNNAHALIIIIIINFNDSRGNSRNSIAKHYKRESKGS